VIIAGHARLLAARKLGIEEVPVIVLAHLTPAQKRALVIADNKLALNAGWDEEILRAELAALQAEGFDLDVVGFSDEELRGLLELGVSGASGTSSSVAASSDDSAVTRPRTTVVDPLAWEAIWPAVLPMRLGPLVRSRGDSRRTEAELIGQFRNLHPGKNAPPTLPRKITVREVFTRPGHSAYAPPGDRSLVETRRTLLHHASPRVL
jgi:hypothetical protein